MNEKNNFTLVPRALSAIEIAKPRAVRILSGMVADTLALAKPEATGKRGLTVLLGKGYSADALRLLIEWKLGEQFDVAFIQFGTEDELLDLTKNGAFDLIVLYLGDVVWNLNSEDDYSRRILNAITRYKGLHPERKLLPIPFRKLYIKVINARYVAGVNVLARLRLRYGKPIVVTSSGDYSREFDGTGVTFLAALSSVETRWDTLWAAFTISLGQNHER